MIGWIWSTNQIFQGWPRASGASWGTRREGMQEGIDHSNFLLFVFMSLKTAMLVHTLVMITRTMVSRLGSSFHWKNFRFLDSVLGWIIDWDLFTFLTCISSGGLLRYPVHEISFFGSQSFKVCIPKYETVDIHKLFFIKKWKSWYEINKKLRLWLWINQNISSPV